MNLHDHKDVFEELTLGAAQVFGLPQAYVEKDYWVSLVLKRLSSSKYHDDFVFKGGTSLSKAHGLIHRFSEDVDLALINRGLSGGEAKKRLKAVEQEITRDLKYIPDHPQESKHGQFRKTYYQYPKLDDGVELKHASTDILLEINAMAVPEPNSLVDVAPLIRNFLVEKGHDELVGHYQLQPFSLRVLDVERTAAEKVIALVRASREDNEGSQLKRKIRHVYDLCMIARDDRHGSYLQSDDFLELLRAVCDSDRKAFENASDWLDPPLHEAPLFSEPVVTWASVSDEFEGPFAEMVYNGEIPQLQEILALLEGLQPVLRKV